MLNPQLATLLCQVHRHFYDKKPGNIPFTTALRHCLLCGGSLEAVKAADIYVQTFQCAQGHQSGERGGNIFLRTKEGFADFQMGWAPEGQKALVKAWLDGGPVMKTNLNGSLEAVLRHFYGMYQ